MSLYIRGILTLQCGVSVFFGGMVFLGEGWSFFFGGGRYLSVPIFGGRIMLLVEVVFFSLGVTF